MSYCRLFQFIYLSISILGVAELKGRNFREIPPNKIRKQGRMNIGPENYEALGVNFIFHYGSSKVMNQCVNFPINNL